jgi:hypothetical protein
MRFLEITAGVGNSKQGVVRDTKLINKAMQYRRIVVWHYNSIPSQTSAMVGAKNSASYISCCYTVEITPCTYYTEGWMRPKSRY